MKPESGYSPARILSQSGATIIVLLVFLASTGKAQHLYSYVDPLIGSRGGGNVFVGPCCPFGMVKPGPDCSLHSTSGYVGDPTVPIMGFSQVHTSGTGGGPKYGNISLMPFMGDFSSTHLSSLRSDEVASLGYYSVNLKRWDVKVEITAAERVALYRCIFNKAGKAGVKIDAGFFLGEEPVPNYREAQQFVGSQVQILSDSSLDGYTRIRGGWNNGNAYTVYFYAIFDRPFVGYGTWKGEKISPGIRTQYDSGEKTGAFLYFDSRGNDTIGVKVGISFISSLKARHNIGAEVPGWNFSKVEQQARDKWESLFGRVVVDGTPDQKTMFYTALYHTMLMPVDRTGENPLWLSSKPYYDDFYTIWDTFRSCDPLITLIDPSRMVKIVNALLNIYEHDGYLPDGRSGNCNGRTQGGSNAEVVIADAYMKKLRGIDYDEALVAMLKDANIPPGGGQDKEGRGGLSDYNRLGYVSTKFVRAGTRTMEYSYDDFCIAEVAKGLGRYSIYRRFIRQSNNWKNLWRNIEDHGSRGFIMPKDESGAWVDSFQCNIQYRRRTYVRYTPLTEEWPLCVSWWSGFFYEATSWEYSLYVPQNVPELIKKCGGNKAFEKRLDTFFDNGYYHAGNEHDFLTSCLYHWIGRPDLSSRRTREIIDKRFTSAPDGLPGNDDSGAMSSWLAFHMMGIYPNAGQPYYLITSPFLKKTVLHLENGKQFEILAKNLSGKNVYIQSATLDGRPFNQAWILHKDIVKGGMLVFNMGPRSSKWGDKIMPPTSR